MHFAETFYFNFVKKFIYFSKINTYKQLNVHQNIIQRKIKTNNANSERDVQF